MLMERHYLKWSKKGDVWHVASRNYYNKVHIIDDVTLPDSSVHILITPIHYEFTFSVW